MDFTITDYAFTRKVNTMLSKKRTRRSVHGVFFFKQIHEMLSLFYLSICMDCSHDFIHMIVG